MGQQCSCPDSGTTTIPEETVLSPEVVVNAHPNAEVKVSQAQDVQENPVNSLEEVAAHQAKAGGDSPTLTVADAEPPKEILDPIHSNLQDIMSHLDELRADRAWEVLKKLQKEFPDKNILEAMEKHPDCRHPLQWLEQWGCAADHVMDALLQPTFPPSDSPREGEPTGSGKWSVFHLTEKEDDGMRGEIYCRYLPGLHGIEMRANLTLPGPFSEHYEGALEVDLGPQVCPICFSSASQWNSSIPGNFLFHLGVKLPKLPRLWWRDILLHRQVFGTDRGLAIIEYSPKCLLRRDGCDRCKAYNNGGEWSQGLPGVQLPKCTVSGRDAQIGGYYFEPVILPDGSQGVHWRSAQLADVTTPRWLPVPPSWYPWAAAFICRRTLREFGRARRVHHEVYEQRVRERPQWYRHEWHHRQADLKVE